MARMSSEGLLDLRRELIAKASRHTAVACHRVRGQFRTELAWIVGTKRHFSQTGEFAFSHTELPVIRHLEEKSPMQRLLHYTILMAGLFHDLGKQIKLFQNKLRDSSAKQSDPIRHERISVVMVLAMLHELLEVEKTVEIRQSAPKNFRNPRRRLRRSNPRTISNDKTKPLSINGDMDWIEPLMDQKKIGQAIQRVEEKGLTHYEYLHPRHWEGSPDVIKPDWFSIGQKKPLPILLTGIVYLILSHHKMPSGRENYVPEEKRFLNRPLELAEGLKLGKAYRTTWSTGSLWQHKVSETASRMHKLLNKEGNPAGKNPVTWFTAIQFLARPALVFADHLVSREGTQQTTPLPSFAINNQDLCYANTTGGKQGTNRKLAQLLLDHLLQVSRKSGRILHLLLELQQNVNAPVVEKAPTQLTKKLTEDSPYYWQQRADDRIARIKNLNKAGFFGVVMAETGSGKTRANARILSALSSHENLRFTVALGLKTLTLQTGDEYLDDIRFDKDNASIMIGSALSKFLHVQKTEARSQDIPPGAESMELDDAQYDGLTGTFEFDPDSPWPEEFIVREKPKLSQLFRVPILICTVDHLVPSVQRPNSSAALMNIRLIASDLVIDEIDSFRPEDLIALLKLCYLTGFNGRRLLVSSATMPPATVRALYCAYSTGYGRFLKATDTTSPIYAGWFTHLPDCQQIRKVDSITAFNRLHRKFAEGYASHMEKSPARRKVQVVKIDDGIKSGNPETVYRTVLQSCGTFHQRHHQIDEKTGIRYSIGAVRWNNVLHTREFVHHWLKHPEELPSSASFLFIAYHAKHLPLILHEMEVNLSELLKRKPGLPGPCGNKHFRNHLDAAARESRKDLILIVSTSPISEVGRDHDYDWAILEPCSYWSLIQMAGRIWRHRPDMVAGAPNIGLLSTSMKVLKENRGGRTFYHPGPETNTFRLDVKDYAKVRNVFDTKKLAKSVTPIFTLLEPYPIEIREADGIKLFSSMKDIEHGRLVHLLEDPDRMHSMEAFLAGKSCGIFFTGCHAEKNPFRRGLTGEPIWYEADPEYNWYKLDNNRRIKINNWIAEDKIDPKNAEHSFFHPSCLDRDTLLEKWIIKLQKHALDNPIITMGFEPERYPGQEDSITEFVYHDLLGWRPA
jgi:CRISPR-associated endonuclease/helicase Cas3